MFSKVIVLLQDGVPFLALLVHFFLIVSSQLMTVVLVTFTMVEPYVAKRFRKRYVSVWSQECSEPLLNIVHCACISAYDKELI